MISRSKSLAKQFDRYICGKFCELLQVEGWRVNHKNVERLWREEGLQLPKRHKKRKRLYHHNAPESGKQQRLRNLIADRIRNYDA